MEFENINRIDFKYIDDDHITGFDEIFHTPIKELCGLSELVEDYTITIQFQKNKISLPSTCEVFQTDGVYIDSIPSLKLQRLPLLSMKGKIGVNQIKIFTVSVSKNPEYWEIPILPKRVASILNCGLVIVTNPQKCQRNIIKRSTKRK